MKNVDVVVDKNKSKKRMLPFNFLKNLFLKTTKETPKNQPTDLIEKEEELIPTHSKKKEMELIDFEESEKNIKPRVGLHNTGNQKETQLLVLDEIKSEVNLMKFPFFALSRKGSKKLTVIEYKDTATRGDEKIDFSWQVSGNVKFGLPGVFDKKVFKAIEQIINQNGWSDNEPIQNPLPFSIYQICKILDIDSTSGKNINAVKESLKRIKTTTIDSQGAFYVKGEKQSLYEDCFSLYNRVTFKNEKLPNGKIAETNFLELGTVYLESLNSFYVKKIDYKYYQKLKSDIARRLYEILDIKFYGLKKHCVSIDYEKLSALLPVAQQKYISKAKEKLQPAHDELIKTNFLKAVEWEKTSRREWQIKYYPSKETMQKINKEAIEVKPEPQKLEKPKEPPKPKQTPPPQKQPKQETAPRQTKKENPLILELTKRGVAKSQAQKLITEHEKKYPGSDLLEVLKCFDHKDKQGEFSTAKNKAGLLVGMIKANDCETPGYKTKSETAKLKQDHKEKERKQREREEQEKLEEWTAKTEQEKLDYWWGGFGWYIKFKADGKINIQNLELVQADEIKKLVLEEIKADPKKCPPYEKYKNLILENTQ